MKKLEFESGIFIPANRKVWEHERHVAEILAQAGYYVEFILEHTQRSADILLDGVPYEIKSPKTTSANSLEHIIKKGLRQCSNLIIDSSRTRMHDDNLRKFLISQMRSRRQIKHMLLIAKRGQIVDISELI